MNDTMKQAWNDVAEDFARLGKVMKEQYQGHTSDSAPDADRADAAEGVRAAFERLLAAGRDFGDRIADVVTADEVRDQAKQTGQRLNEATTTSADVLGEQLRGVFKRVGRRSDAGESETDAEDAPVDATHVGSAGSAAEDAHEVTGANTFDKRTDELPG